LLMLKKNNLFLGMIMLFIGLILPISASAKTDFNIQVKDGVKTLVEYTGKDGNVNIPDGVEVIGENAFAKNKLVKKVVLSDTVKKIENYAFNECTYLKEVKVSKALTRIYTGAFRNCKKLKYITINKNLKNVDEFAFAGCSGLSKIKVEKGNKYFKVYRGALCSKDMKTLYLYPASMKVKKKYIIPKSVKTVMPCAFENNGFLTEIIVEGKIESGEASFSRCRTLKNVVFKKPYKNAVDFSKCKKLEKVKLAEGTRMIGESQFAGCKNLKTINYPDSLEYIDMYAFQGCLKIKKPVFSSNVEVDKTAFE